MYTFNDLLDIMDRLRGEGGCPWDAEQTHHSLRRYVVEEAYEVADAIDSGNKEELADELGDLLLQIVFHARIAKENGDFTIDDVINCVCRKMVNRHPHVFGDIDAKNSDEVLDNWAKIKKKEKGQSTEAQTLASLPKSLPALLRAYKVQERASKVGFDWDDMQPAYEKLLEECGEFIEEYNKGDEEKTEEELGDLLFAAVNVARFCGNEPEMTLNAAVDKFIRRFTFVEQTAKASGKSLRDMSLAEMDEIWEKAKKVKNI